MSRLSVAQALDHATRTLSRAGIERPRFEARLLLGHALGARQEDVIGYPERFLDESAAREFDALCCQRATRKPMAQILGKREFWGLTFRVTKDVLDPRPDSETLVEAALSCFPGKESRLRALDLGTGSGCLLLSFLHERRQSSGLGIDLSPAAVSLAQENAQNLGLAGCATFRSGNWAEGVAESFDLIFSNPPYIRSGDIQTLEPEISGHEPHLALNGGTDGFESYRLLIPQAACCLAPEGRLILEIGAGQKNTVAGLLEDAGFDLRAVLPDLSGIERCLVAGLNTPRQKA